MTNRPSELEEHVPLNIILECFALISTPNNAYLIRGMKMLCCILFALLPLLSSGGEGATINGAKKESSAATQKTDSGIRGVVVRWPVKPSSRAGETNSAPMPNVIVSVQPQNGGPEIARQKANERGRFEFKLPPGKYLIVPVLEPGLRFRVRKQTVEVLEKKFTEVVLTCDTGIR